jgi:uncharacterized protein YjdB
MTVRRMLASALALLSLTAIGCSRTDQDFDFLYAGGDLAIAKGREFVIDAVAVKRDNTGTFVTSDSLWSSSAPEIVDVVLTPKVHLVTKLEGKARITATYGNSTASFEVTVTPHVLDRVNVTADRSAIQQGETAQFALEVIYSDMTRTVLEDGEKIVWSSSGPTVAYVNPVTGLATGLAEGKVTVTAKLMKLDTVTDEYRIVDEGSTSLSVAAYPVSVTLYPSAQEMLKGRAYQLVALVMFSDGYRSALGDYTLKYTSSDTSVTKVSPTGLVTAIGAGTATITVELQEPAADGTSMSTVIDASGAAIQATANVTVVVFPVP